MKATINEALEYVRPDDYIGIKTDGFDRPIFIPIEKGDNLNVDEFGYIQIGNMHYHVSHITEIWRNDRFLTKYTFWTNDTEF